ncbi:MAG: HlyD family efflux transporter periplasmic adaptor subunit [bacterium]|nr:HlyD family efflux transporter periplasmic adaptor subunit [bacterium]
MNRSTIAWIIAALTLAACGPRDEIPTFRVERRAFDHRVTAEGILKAAKVTSLTVPTEVEVVVRLAWLAPGGQVVEAGDVVARFDPSEMEVSLVEGRLDLDSAGVEVDKTRLESDRKVADFGTRVEVAELELDHAKRYQKIDEGAYSRRDIIESAIDAELAGERQMHAAGSRRTQQSLARTELDLLAIKQRQAQLKIDQAQSALEALEVRAPHGGLLTLVRDWRGDPIEIGSEMWRGQTVAEIPDLSVMEAEVFVLEADAGGLETGKPATVVIEAHPDIVYPATISRIDAVAKPRFRGSPVQFFGVTLEFGKTGAIMKPGQRVRATLELAELEDTLVVPRQAVFQHDGHGRVYLRDGGGYAPRRVETGASSMGLMVVTDGLAEGDVVALRLPANGDALEEKEARPSPEISER